MLNLLIADDEIYDRESIVNMINSEFDGEIQISEAKNGREAIEVAERVRPDIIITDIKMPGINGLKALEKINKFLPNSYFIVLTAYDYFDFAVEAVKNNVKQYILKPFSKEEIIEKMKTAINFVNSDKEKRKSEIENEEKISNLIPIIENELSYSIINDALNLIDYETYLKYLNLNFLNGYSMVVEIKDNNQGNVKLKVAEYIKHYINRKYRAIGSYLFTKNLVYFIQLKENEVEQIKNISENLSFELKGEVKKTFNIILNVGIGRCYEGLLQLHNSYEEACTSLESIANDNGVTYFGDIYNTEKLNINNGDKFALFKSVEQYITGNISEEIDLEKTAAKFNLSSYYFSRTFKEALGCNFSDYVNMVRIKKAKELLKNDAVSIKEVCYLVGYTDPNYFSKVFKKYEGLSPTEFKTK